MFPRPGVLHPMNAVCDAADDPRYSSMAHGKLEDQGLARVLEQLRAIDDVSFEERAEGNGVLLLSANSRTRELEITRTSGDYRIQKTQYEYLRAMLLELGIVEGAIYTPPPPPRRGMTLQIRAARDAQKRAFDAWQEAWRAIRKAEKALDVEYEITQMKDYY